MAQRQDKFNDALLSAKIPILILDNKWHRIFGKMNPTKEIKRLEAELSELLRKQGKLVNENKDLKKIKSNLMSDIVANMDDASGATNTASDKKLAENKKLINDVNERLDANEDMLLDIPKDIDRVNKQLMLSTMEMCYERLQDNTEQIEEIGEWIKDIRIQLKRNIIKKQDMEIYNAELYSYMHDIFGPSVMEIFDMKYIPSIHKAKEQEVTSTTKKDSSDNNE